VSGPHTGRWVWWGGGTPLTGPRRQRRAPFGVPRDSPRNRPFDRTRTDSPVAAGSRPPGGSTRRERRTRAGHDVATPRLALASDGAGTRDGTAPG
jgi:hypothetical protein